MKYNCSCGHEIEYTENDIQFEPMHRLLNGDSTDSDSVMRLMHDGKADLVCADPPYGVEAVSSSGYTGGGGKVGFVGGKGIVNPRQYSQIINDDSTDTAKEFYNTCMALEMDRMIIWGGNYFTDFLPPSRCWLVWDKKEAKMENTFADCELAWCSMDGNATIYRHLWAGLLRKGSRELELKDRVHPTQKPIGLYMDILKDYEWSIVFDGFLGSGSTMVASYQLKRKCYGMELDPKYCAVIIDRMLKLDETLVIKRNGEIWQTTKI